MKSTWVFHETPPEVILHTHFLQGGRCSKGEEGQPAAARGQRGAAPAPDALRVQGAESAESGWTFRVFGWSLRVCSARSQGNRKFPPPPHFLGFKNRFCDVQADRWFWEVLGSPGWNDNVSQFKVDPTDLWSEAHPRINLPGLGCGSRQGLFPLAPPQNHKRASQLVSFRSQGSLHMVARI